jgi:transcriptional regulator with XRE-family HTH domain
MDISSERRFQQKYIGSRVRRAREELHLTQQALSRTLGFKDRQSLSAIEQGIRAVSAEELVKLTQALGRELEYFIDPFNVAGEAKFSWRVAAGSLDEVSTAREFAPIFGLMRWLCQKDLTSLKRSLRIDETSSREASHDAGLALRAELKMGAADSLRGLRLAVEQKLGILVAFLALPRGITSGLCRLTDCELLAVSSRLAPEQQAIELSSALFYALTYDALKPESEILASPRPTPGPKAQRLCASFVEGFLSLGGFEGASPRAFSLNVVERLKTALEEGRLSVRKAQKLLGFADLESLNELLAAYGLEHSLLEL